MKTRGVDPKSHPVVAELVSILARFLLTRNQPVTQDRVRQYFDKIKDAEDPEKRTSRLSPLSPTGLPILLSLPPLLPRPYGARGTRHSRSQQGRPPSIKLLRTASSNTPSPKSKTRSSAPPAKPNLTAVAAAPGLYTRTSGSTRMATPRPQRRLPRPRRQRARGSLQGR